MKVSARRRRRATGNVAEADYTADVEAPADEDALKNFNGTSLFIKHHEFRYFQN